MVDFDALLTGPLVAALGEPATLVRPDGTLVPTTGIFEQKHLSLEFDSGPPQSEVSVTLLIQVSALADGFVPARGTVVLVRGASFEVADPQRSEDGSMTLVLTGRTPLPHARTPA